AELGEREVQRLGRVAHLPLVGEAYVEQERTGLDELTGLLGRDLGHRRRVHRRRLGHYAFGCATPSAEPGAQLPRDLVAFAPAGGDAAEDRRVRGEVER